SPQGLFAAMAVIRGVDPRTVAWPLEQAGRCAEGWHEWPGGSSPCPRKPYERHGRAGAAPVRRGARRGLRPQRRWGQTGRMRPPDVGRPLSESRSADRLDGKLMSADELLGLGAGEDPLGRADGADTACTDGAGQLEAVELRSVFQKPDDVAGVEGVAASR